MRLPFGRRTAELETMNRILTDAARNRAERIKELEHQFPRLKTALASAHKRATDLEVVEAQREHLLNEKDEELAGVREALTQHAHLLNEKDEACGCTRSSHPTRALAQ
jgi:chromosome segregation ATPase